MFELKVAQLSPKVAQKVGAAIFSKKVTFFNSAQKATKYLGYLLKKICHKYLSKIAQSGCTDYVRAASFESSHINWPFDKMMLLLTKLSPEYPMSLNLSNLIFIMAQ